MKKLLPSSIRFRLLLLGLFGLVPAFLVIFAVSNQHHKSITTDAQDNVLRLARMVASEQQRWIEQSQDFVMVLAHLPEVRQQDTLSCNSLFADLVEHNAYFANFGVADVDGNVFCSARPEFSPTNSTDQVHFQQALATKGFAVGEYQIDMHTGQTIVPFAYPSFDDAVNVQAVVSASIQLSWLETLITENQLPPEASLTILDDDGKVLIRFPDNAEWIGVTSSAATAISGYLNQKEGIFEAIDLNGELTLFGFSQLENGTYISLGIPKNLAYEEANLALRNSLLLLGAVSILAGIALWIGSDVFVFRKVGTLLQATQKMAAGDLTVRIGQPHNVDELGQLAQSFDHMAETLNTRQEEREKILLDLRDSEARVRQDAFRAQALARMAAQLNAQLDIEAVLDMVCEQTAHVLDVPVASVSLYDNHRQLLTHAAGFGLPSDFGERLQPVPGKAFGARTREMGAVSVVPDIQQCPELPNASIYAEVNIRTLAGVSMSHDGVLVGRLNVGTVKVPRTFSDDELALLKSVADQAALAIANARSFAEAARRMENLRALRNIDMAITSSLDLRVTLNVVLDQVANQLGIDAVSILRYNQHMQLLEYTAGRGFRSNEITHSRLRLGEGKAGLSALEQKFVHVENLPESDFSRRDLVVIEGFIAYYAVPLVAKGQVKGVMEIFNCTPLNPDQDWLEFLETLAGQAAIAIDNASLFSNLQRSNLNLALAYDSTLEGWAGALDLRDKETEGHSRRVTDMTVRIAQEIDIPEDELVQIKRGALLHDIGKMGIPDAILLKPGPLSDDEWQIMRQHPGFAYKLLAPIAYLRPALDIPYNHHEKWDGTGYPRGLKGEEIPLAARIFAVVDVWDALSSDRPYRQAWDQNKVLDHIQNQSGTHFDPQVVEIFLAVMNLNKDNK